ncbi:MAG: type II toxin-antitoxin system RelE/ParE family toxin [Acidobacteriia bacterium]|nr:type II toxin-antitoxin system RelE/ParE family toxin [Terriglobia bacterium]
MKFLWPESARAELRAVERETAIRILWALTRYGDTGEGDVKRLAGEWQGYSRLRIGDHRVIFLARPTEIVVVRVRHRSDVYR